jgi:hypothetical protein
VLLAWVTFVLVEADVSAIADDNPAMPNASAVAHAMRVLNINSPSTSGTQQTEFHGDLKRDTYGIS